MKVAEILRTIFTFITAAAMTATFILLLSVSNEVVPQVEQTLTDIQGAADNLDTLSGEISTSLKAADQVFNSLQGVDELVASTTKMVEDNTESLGEALQHFNEIPFDDLSAAIKDLKDVVEPLANFTNAFR